MAIYLSHDSTEQLDGSGAQVQRIFAIYSLSKLLKVKYLHSKIESVDFNPGDGIQTSEEMESYRQKLNESLSFLETEEVEGSIGIDFRLCRLKLARLNLLYFLYYFAYFAGLRAYTRMSGKKYVLLINDPYPLIDRIPNAYKYVQNEILNAPSIYPKDVISIQLHLVRAKVSSTFLQYRFTYDDWYIQILDKILPILEMRELKYEILIHTDVSANGIWRMPSGISPKTLEYWKNSGIKFDDNNMEIATNEVLGKFKKYQNVKVVTGIDSVEAWKMISNADLFLMGKSSFSYVGALYNSNGIVVTTKFWHSTPSSWYSINENFSLTDQSQCAIIARKLANI